MVGKARCYIHITNGGTPRLEAPSCSYADDQVGPVLLDSQVGGQGCRHSAHIVHTMDAALACVAPSARINLLRAGCKHT